jgi:hypothetical protein
MVLRYTSFKIFVKLQSVDYEEYSQFLIERSSKNILSVIFKDLTMYEKGKYLTFSLSTQFSNFISSSFKESIDASLRLSLVQLESFLIFSNPSYQRAIFFNEIKSEEELIEFMKVFLIKCTYTTYEQEMYRPEFEYEKLQSSKKQKQDIPDYSESYKKEKLLLIFKEYSIQLI